MKIYNFRLLSERDNGDQLACVDVTAWGWDIGPRRTRNIFYSKKYYQWYFADNGEPVGDRELRRALIVYEASDTFAPWESKS